MCAMTGVLPDEPLRGSCPMCLCPGSLPDVPLPRVPGILPANVPLPRVLPDVPLPGVLPDVPL
ncbi:unnamed protein product, partial [Staurois parvus]